MSDIVVDGRDGYREREQFVLPGHEADLVASIYRLMRQDSVEAAVLMPGKAFVFWIRHPGELVIEHGHCLSGAFNGLGITPADHVRPTAALKPHLKLLLPLYDIHRDGRADGLGAGARLNPLDVRKGGSGISRLHTCLGIHQKDFSIAHNHEIVDAHILPYSREIRLAGQLLQRKIERLSVKTLYVDSEILARHLLLKSQAVDLIVSIDSIVDGVLNRNNGGLDTV